MNEDYEYGTKVGRTIGYATVYGIMNNMVNEAAAQGRTLTVDEVQEKVLSLYEKGSKHCHQMVKAKSLMPA